MVRKEMVAGQQEMAMSTHAGMTISDEVSAEERDVIDAAIKD